MFLYAVAQEGSCVNKRDWVSIFFDVGTFDGGENDSNLHIEQHYSGSASHSAVVQTLKGLLIIFIDPPP